MVPKQHTQKRKIKPPPRTKLVNNNDKPHATGKQADENLGGASSKFGYKMREYVIPKGYPGEMREGAIYLSGDEAIVADAIFKHLEYVTKSFASARYLNFSTVDPTVNLHFVSKLVTARLKATGLASKAHQDSLGGGKIGYLCSKDNFQDMYMKVVMESAKDSLSQTVAGIPEFNGEAIFQSRRHAFGEAPDKVEPYTIPDGLPGEMQNDMVCLPGDDQAQFADSVLKHLEFVARTTRYVRNLSFKSTSGTVDLEAVKELVQNRLDETEIGTRTKLTWVNEVEDTISYSCATTKYESDVYTKISEAILDGMFGAFASVPGLNKRVQEKMKEGGFEL